MRTEITNLRTEVARLDGRIYAEVAKINGELKSIRLWMKLLVAVGILGMPFFSLATIKLL